MPRSLLLATLLPVLAGGAFAVEPKSPPSPKPPAQAAPAQLVPYEKLTPFLPEPPEGWGAERADGSTTDSGEIHMSTVRRSYYQKGDADDLPVAVVTIIDATSNAELFGAAEGEEWATESESEDGFDRRVEIEGMRALEHYSREARTGSLSVFVGGRYFVQIELTNDTPEALRGWLKRLDVRKLAALK